MSQSALDLIIKPETAKTLSGLFRQRVAHSAAEVAYRYFDGATQQWSDVSWQQMKDDVAACQAAMAKLALTAGDRVGIMAKNGCEWVVFEQAALGLGLVVVPLYANDRPDSVAYILRDSGVALLLIDTDDQGCWCDLKQAMDEHGLNPTIWSINAIDGVAHMQALMAEVSSCELQSLDSGPDELATIVYTSGTTGPPKGVMLSHQNILWNAYAGIRAEPIQADDLFLSFLPLSHTLERTVGYYLPMMAGATVAYARSIPQLAEDLLTIRPTVLISVPRIYERVYNRIQESLVKPVARRLFEKTVALGWQRFEIAQGRASWSPALLLWPVLNKLVAAKVMAKLGGRLRVAICGGAPLPSKVGQTFVALGLNLLQGYGLTESSPVISVNVQAKNDPSSVGPLLPDVEIKLADNDELLTRSPGIMLGYWNNPEASAKAVDSDGWLHTGDKGRMDEGRLYITGRIKDIIVLANGEKVPPANMEDAIVADPLLEQVMVLGENRPFLSALVVLNPQAAKRLDIEDVLDEDMLKHKVLPRLCGHLSSFPGYAQVRKVAVVHETWTVENGLLTPTLKLKRARIMERYKVVVDKLYHGHE